MIEKELLVIGGGPGGAIAAKEAAEKDIETLLIEKRQEIGVPVRCAEGVGKKVEEFINLSDDLISQDVVGAKIYSPSNVSFQMTEEVAGNEVGYILNRKEFDRKLVEKAVEEGTEVRLRTRAKDLERSDEKIIAQAMRNGEEIKIRANTIIAADGVESRIGRLAGISDSIDIEDIESCAQYLVTGIDNFDLNYTHFYLGKKIAPGGYAWVFPKGEASANIGLGVQPTRAKKRPREYLDDFIKKLELEGNIVEEMFGGVPVAAPLESLVSDNIMLVGDAARQSDPITGGGIINAMKAGKMAAETVKLAKEQDDYTRETLSYYDEKREDQIKEKIQRNYKLKELFQSLSDEQYNSIVSSLKGSDFENLSISSLISVIIKENPQIAKEIREII